MEPKPPCFATLTARRSDEYDILPTEIHKVKAADGALLYARLIKPAGFAPGTKYPVIVVVYGGPGIQVVHDSWPGSDLGSGARSPRVCYLAAR